MRSEFEIRIEQAQTELGRALRAYQRNDYMAAINATARAEKFTNRAKVLADDQRRARMRARADAAIEARARRERVRAHR